MLKRLKGLITSTWGWTSVRDYRSL